MNNNVRVFKDSIKRGNGFLFFCSAGIACGGFLLLWLYIKVTSGSFDGSNGGLKFDAGGANLEILMLLPALGLIAFALFILFFMYIKVMKRSFELHHDKIISKYKNEIETSINFEDIKEVYRCRTLAQKAMVPYGLLDVFCYRESKDDYWKVIRPVLYEGSKKYRGLDLIEAMIDKYVEANINNALNDLEKGNPIEFDYLEYPKGISMLNKRDNFDRTILSLSEKPLVNNNHTEKAKHYLDVDTQKIVLTKDSITIDNMVYFEKGDEIVLQTYNLGGFIGKKPKDFEVGKVITITNNGKEKISIDLTRLINGDLFLEIVKNLLK